MEFYSHLWAGASQYHLEPFHRIQRRIIGDPIIGERCDTLAFGKDVSLLCVLYLIYHGERSGELFVLVLAIEILNRTLHHKLKYHSHPMNT